MSTKESIHSAKSGRSAHSNQESLLVDTQYNPNQKKRTMWAGIIALVLFVLMGVAVFFAIYQSTKLSDNKDRKKMLEQEIERRTQRREHLVTYKVLNLSDIRLKDVVIELNPDGDRTIQVLNLTNNYIEDFDNFNLPNLTILLLEGNPLRSFTNNKFEILSDLSLPGSSIVDFDKNYLPKIKSLNLKNHKGLLSFENNHLPQVANFEITETLVDFNNNYLPNSQTFKIDQLKQIQSFSGNTLNIDSLFISSPQLKSFSGNSFPKITEATINESSLESLSFQNSPELTTLIINNSPLLKSITLKNLPKLSQLILQTPALITVIIDNVNITQFPLKTNVAGLAANLFNIQTLRILNSPVESCNLLNMSNLLTLELAHLPLTDINLVKGKQNKIQSITLQDIRMVEFTNYSIPNLAELVFIDNLRLEKFDNNTLPSLTEFSIVGKSALNSFFNNSLSNLEKLAIVDSTDATLILKQMVKNWITGLYLINNNISKIDFTGYANLTYLAILDNPIQKLELINLPKLSQLFLTLDQLTSLTISNTSITSFDEEQQVTFFLNASKLQYLKIALTPITQFYYEYHIPSLKHLYLQSTQIEVFGKNNLPQLTELHIVKAPLATLELNSSINSLQLIEIQRTLVESLGELVFPGVSTIEFLDNAHTTIFDTALFPNLTHLMINAETEGSLETLIIRDSLLTEFKYDLKYLRNLLIHNNTKLITFVDSNLPRLNTLEIVNTPLTSFRANTFSSLQKVKFVNVNISQIDPSYDKTLVELYLDNNGLKTLPINAFINLESLVVINNNISDVNIKDLPKLSKLTLFIENLQYFKIQNTAVTDLAFHSSVIQNISIIDTPISNFSGQILQSLNHLELRNNNLTLFERNNIGGIESLAITGSPNLLEATLKDLYQLKVLELSGLGLSDFTAEQALFNVTQLILTNNKIKTIDTSEMVKLEKLRLEGDFTHIVIGNSQITSFSDGQLDSLQSLTLVNNTKLTEFKNNSLDSLLALSIINTPITSSEDNSFPLLSTLRIQKTNASLQNLLDSISPERISRLILSNVEIPETMNFNQFTTLNYLEISKVNLVNFTLSNLPVQSLVLEIPNLTNLYLNNVSVPNYDFNGIPNLKLLQIQNSPSLNKFDGQKLGNLQSLSLINNKIATFFNNTITNLVTLIINDTTTTSVSILVAPKLSALTLITPALKTLNVNAPVDILTVPSYASATSIALNNVLIPNLHISSAPLLTDFTINSPSITELILENVNALAAIKASSTPELTTLEISDSAIANVNTLTVAKLTKLSIIKSTATALTLPTAPLLQTLILKTVNILSLDLAAYPLLKTVELEIDSLKTLRLRQNKQITTIQTFKLGAVEDISIVNSGLTRFTLLTFPQLKTLSLQNNSLVTFTNNTHPILTSLTIVDQHLEQIDVFKNNLSTLIINCPLLEVLSIFDSPLTHLRNISVPRLQQLIISNVALTGNGSQAILPLPELLAIDIEKSQIKSIDFDGFPKLDDVALKYAQQLQTITVTKDSPIVKLDILDSPLLVNIPLNHFPKLKLFFLDNIGSINVTGATLPSLIELNFEGVKLDKLQSLGLTKQIQTITISNSPTLQSIDPKECQKWTNLSTFSAQNTAISVWNCSCENLTTLAISQSPLTQALIYLSPKLDEIRFKYVEMVKFEGFTLPNLRKLILNNMPKLAKMQDNNFPSLTLLDLRDLPLLQSFTAGSDYSSLTRLFIYNCSAYSEQYPSSNFPVMLQIGLLNTTVKKVTIGSTITTVAVGNEKMECPIESLSFDQNSNIQYFAGINTQITRISSLTLENLKNLFLCENYKLSNFEKNTFEELTFLNLTNTIVSNFTSNKLSILKSLHISHAKLNNFKDNTLPKLERLLAEQNQLTTLQQALPEATDADLSNNKFQSVENINLGAHLPKVSLLNLGLNLFTTFNEVTHGAVTSLELYNNTALTEFKNNNFAKLQSLNFNGSSATGLAIEGNTLPLLENLFLNDCKGLNETALLNQLTVALVPKLKRIELIGVNYQANTITTLRDRFGEGLNIVTAK